MFSNYVYTGIGVVIGLIGLLKLVTTKTFDAVTYSRTVQFTISHTISSQSAVFTSIQPVAPTHLPIGTADCPLTALPRLTRSP